RGISNATGGGTGVSPVRRAGTPAAPFSLHRRAREVPLQESQGAAASILPVLAIEAMTRSAINLHLVRYRFLFKDLLQVVGLGDWHGGVGIAVQDERGTQAPHEEFHFFRKAAEEIDHGFHALIDGRYREREIGAQ